MTLRCRTYGTRNTPLHYAAGAGDVDLCKRLIAKGAKVNTWDFYQFTAVDYAKQSGATDCVAHLEEVSTPGATTTGDYDRQYRRFANDVLAPHSVRADYVYRCPTLLAMDPIHADCCVFPCVALYGNCRPSTVVQSGLKSVLLSPALL